MRKLPSTAFKKGQTPWNKGKKTGVKSPTQFKKGVSSWNKGKKSPWVSERNKVMNRARTREKHPMWKGGISKIDKNIREMPEYKKWRTEVFQRDNWTCQTCQSRGYVTAHHIKGFSKILKEYQIKTTLEALECAELWDITNGVTLCEPCHALTDNYKHKGK